jgi:hypothetical protein
MPDGRHEMINPNQVSSQGDCPFWGDLAGEFLTQCSDCITCDGQRTSPLATLQSSFNLNSVEKSITSWSSPDAGLSLT